MSEVAKTTHEGGVINVALTVDELECLLHDVNNRVLVERTHSTAMGEPVYGGVPGRSMWETIRSKLIRAAEQEGSLLD